MKNINKFLRPFTLHPHPKYEFSLLRQKVAERVPSYQKDLMEVKKKYGDKVIGQYTVGQVIGGMRGMKAIFSDVSTVDPLSGILFKGYTIPQIKDFLPKIIDEPLCEGLFWLLMTGELPQNKEVESVKQEWQERGVLGDDIIQFILNLPKDIHPMTMLSMSLLFMQKDSIFAKKYSEGTVHKKNYWEYFYEDAMNLISRIPRVAAIIYRHKYRNSKLIEPDMSLDWAGNYGHMLGFDGDPIKECLRGYLSVHSDHEGGNVSAHTCHLVGSALSDPYLSFSAGVNGLAGPLHGLANQEVLKWILEFQEKYGTNVTDEDIENYVDQVIGSGRVVPGYGHAVLRETDPRFIHQFDFSSKWCKNDPLIKLLHQCAEVIPKKLKTYGKIKNPYPNVDCHSGVTLYSLGMKEYEYYTVVFAVSRALGCMTNLIWSRAFGLPIERPGSADLNWFHHKFRE